MPKRKVAAPRRKAPARGRRKRPYTVSDRVREANKRNAQLIKTKKKSPEGLKASSMNALKHARYAETPVLPGEDEIAHSQRSELWAELLGSESSLERYIAGLANQAAWNVDRTQSAHRDVLHRRMLKAEKQGRRESERVAVALADQLRERPVEVAAELKDSAAGCLYLYEQFERLQVMLNTAGGFTRNDFEWCVRLFGRRMTDLFCDRLVLGLAVDHLGTADYPDGRRADLPRARELFCEYAPPEMMAIEVDVRLNSWFAIVPCTALALASLKSKVAAELSRLRLRRETLLVEEAVERQLNVGAVRVDETLEGSRRSHYLDSQIRTFEKMIKLATAIRKGRLSGAFGELVEINGFIHRASQPAAAAADPEPENQADSDRRNDTDSGLQVEAESEAAQEVMADGEADSKAPP
jgi:hypothetical protein